MEVVEGKLRASWQGKLRDVLPAVSLYVSKGKLGRQRALELGCPRKWHFGIPRNTEVISGSIPAKFRGIPRNFAEFRRNWAEITSEVKKFRGIPCRRNSVDTLARTGRDLAEWLERLTANAEVATVLGLIPASSDHSWIWGLADEAVLNKVLKNSQKIPKKTPLKRTNGHLLGSLRFPSGN